MSKQRDLQHIVDKEAMEKAEIDGTKVTANCGAAIYPMPKMKDEIPACMPCVRVVLNDFNALRRRQAATFTWNSTSGPDFMFGGAA